MRKRTRIAAVVVANLLGFSQEKETQPAEHRNRHGFQPGRPSV